MAFDLVIRGAQLRGVPELTDIGISEGLISEIAPRVTTESSEVIDAGGRLVVPGFIDSHFHIGKSFYGREAHRYDYRQPEWDPPGLAKRYQRRYRSAMADYELRYENIIPIVKQWAWKEAYTVEDVARRIGEALTGQRRVGHTDRGALCTHRLPMADEPDAGHKCAANTIRAPSWLSSVVAP